MKNLLKTLATSAVAAAAFGGVGSASAAVICSGCAYVDPVPTLTAAPNVNFANNLGIHNPLTGDNSTFSHGGLGNGSFTDWWVFTVNPAGLAGINAIFIPTTSIDFFKIELYAVSASTCAANSASAIGQCTSVTLAGGPIFSAFAVPDFVVNAPLMPMFGSYAFKISGVSTDAPLQENSYTGNVTTKKLAVPEPGTLALAALALLGVGAVGRQRRA